jgi:hypothetical protein
VFDDDDDDNDDDDSDDDDANARAARQGLQNVRSWAALSDRVRYSGHAAHGRGS